MKQEAGAQKSESQQKTGYKKSEDGRRILVTAGGSKLCNSGVFIWVVLGRWLLAIAANVSGAW
jgi:hypothetical protein